MSAHVEIVEIPHVPYGPEGDPRAVDAEYYREAARNIRYQAGRGNAFAGSNLTETVAKLCEAAADALERPGFQPFVTDEWWCTRCGSACDRHRPTSPNIDPDRSTE